MGERDGGWGGILGDVFPPIKHSSFLSTIRSYFRRVHMLYEIINILRIASLNLREPAS